MRVTGGILDTLPLVVFLRIPACQFVIRQTCNFNKLQVRTLLKENAGNFNKKDCIFQNFALRERPSRPGQAKTRGLRGGEPPHPPRRAQQTGPCHTGSWKSLKCHLLHDLFTFSGPALTLIGEKTAVNNGKRKMGLLFLNYYGIIIHHCFPNISPPL